MRLRGSVLVFCLGITNCQIVFPSKRREEFQFPEGVDGGAGAAGGACPAPIGIPAVPGCNKTFVQDSFGATPCQDDEDCPLSLQWWEENDNICRQPGNVFTRCSEDSCIQISADVMCGHWEEQACVDVTERTLTVPSGETVKHFRHTLVIPRSASGRNQHRNSVINPRTLEALNLQCKKQCEARLERYFQKVRYFSEESLEQFRSMIEFEHEFEYHPDVTWSGSGKSLVLTLPKIYRDNSPATFRRCQSGKGYWRSTEDWCIQPAQNSADTLKIETYTCETTQDCYQLNKHLNLDPSFQSNLNLTCEPVPVPVPDRDPVTGVDFVGRQRPGPGTCRAHFTLDQTETWRVSPCSTEIPNFFNAKDSSETIRTCHSKDSLSCLGKGGSFLSGGAPLNYVSPVVGISTISSRRCFQCSPLSCPPSSPCRLGGSCGRPACTRRGRCWCRRPRRG